MKLIPLVNSAKNNCFFLHIGGYEILLDCKIHFNLAHYFQNAHSIRIPLPSLNAVSLETMDLILCSDSFTVLMLPILFTHFNFKGPIYMTELTLKIGKMHLEELLILMDSGTDVAFHLIDTNASIAMNNEWNDPLLRFNRQDFLDTLRNITTVEYHEVVSLPYNLFISAVSSSASLGSCIWTIKNSAEKFVYVPATSVNRHGLGRELDVSRLCEASAMLLTNMKIDRDPLASRARMLDNFFDRVNRIVHQNGIAIVVVPFSDMILELIDAAYELIEAQKLCSPIVCVISCFQLLLDLEDTGAEWLSKRCIEKMYEGKAPFVLNLLRKKKVLAMESDFVTASLHAYQNGAVVFTTYGNLQLSSSQRTLQCLAKEKRVALLFPDPVASLSDCQCTIFTSAGIEIITCPIDSHLSCGDANQMITRCCPENLILSSEYLPQIPAKNSIKSLQNAESDDASQSKMDESSHLIHILPLKTLCKTANKQKLEAKTLPLIHLQQIIIEKSTKFVDGFLDPQLAAQMNQSEVNGKAVGLLSGKLQVNQSVFLIKPLIAPSDSDYLEQAHSGAKRKGADSLSGAIAYHEAVKYYVGTVHEEKLMKRIKLHDSNLQIIVSDIGSDKCPETLLNIPSLHAKITLWKTEEKSLIEAETEEVRVLLRSFMLEQLSVIA